MEIETASLPIEVKAIRIDGKKLTKSMMLQFEENNWLKPGALTNTSNEPTKTSLSDFVSGSLICRHRFNQDPNDHQIIQFLWHNESQVFTDRINLTRLLQEVSNHFFEMLQSLNSFLHELLALAKHDKLSHEMIEYDLVGPGIFSRRPKLTIAEEDTLKAVL